MIAGPGKLLTHKQSIDLANLNPADRAELIDAIVKLLQRLERDRFGGKSPEKWMRELRK